MIIVALVVFGLIFGSFINALTWRLRAQAERADAAAAKRPKKAATADLSDQQLSMTRGRSICSNCHHELAPKDLVPLFSWLYLRGKCRYCRRPIEDSPLVELALPLLFVASYLFWPAAFNHQQQLVFGFWLLFLVGFTALAVYDLRWYLLPNRLVFPLLGLAVVQVAALGVQRHEFSAIWQPALGGVIIYGLFWVLFQVSQGAWIGGGDVKLGLVLGLLAGTPLKACLVIFLASLFGTLASLPTITQGRQGLGKRIPFGPFLLLATVVVVLFGTVMINWYQRLLGV